jgi:hypothetical protein
VVVILTGVFFSVFVQRDTHTALFRAIHVLGFCWLLGLHARLEGLRGFAAGLSESSDGFVQLG